MKLLQKNSVRPVLAVFSSVLLAVASTPYLYAADLSVQSGVNAVHGTGQPSDIFGATGVFSTITNTLLFIIGALSVIMLIFGGLRYVISGGNSTAVTAAKNTILYAIVGLVIAILAYAIINFVLGTFTSGMGTGTGGTNT